MSTDTCYTNGCGRVHGITGPYQLCTLHRHELDAGVEVALTTGYTLVTDHTGTMRIRAPRKEIAAVRESEVAR